MMIKYRLAEILLVPKIGLLIRVMAATASERFVQITGRVEEIRGLTTRDAMTGWRGVERSPSHRNEVSSAQEAFSRVHVKGGVMDGSVAIVQAERDVVGLHRERHGDCYITAGDG